MINIFTIHGITALIGTVFLIAQTIYSLIVVSPLSGEDIGSKIISRTGHIIEQTNAIIERIELCDQKECPPEIFNTMAQSIYQDFEILKKITADEKTFATITSIPAFNLLKVNIEQYQDDGDIEVFHSDLISDIAKVEETHESLKLTYVSRQKEQKNKFLIVHTILSITAFFFYAIAITSVKWDRRKRYRNENGSLNSFSEAIQEWNRDTVNTRISNTDLCPQERKSYSKILSVMNTVTSLQEQIDLYGELYNVVGYEIREITNKIKGGIDVLTEDADENEQIMLRQIMLAAQTLEGLAENFNQLFSAGKIEQSNIVDVYTLGADISLALSSKIMRTDAVMESYFDKSVPPSIYGSHISIFWFLLLQFSSDITTNSGKNAILMMRSKSAENIDKVSVIFDLVFTDEMSYSIEAINNMRWENIDDEYMCNRNIMQHLLQDSSNFTISRHSYKELHKVQIAFEVSPNTYPTYDKPLDGQNLLLCGASITQIDILATTLESFGAKIHYAKTPNDVFKSISSKIPYNGIFITDTIPGVVLSSFCKTLRSRIKTGKTSPKLFLSVSNHDSVRDIQDQVDGVFYRPSEPRLFIKSLCESLKKDEAEKEEYNETVLLVEDDELQQMILSSILSGYEIICDIAPTGEKAIEMLQENKQKPALIFMDCIMPGMGGIEATRRIRAKESKDNVANPLTIIGATALSGESEQKKCIEAGMDILISKPYKRDEIDKIVKKYMALFKSNEKKVA